MCISQKLSSPPSNALFMLFEITEESFFSETEMTAGSFETIFPELKKQFKSSSSNSKTSSKTDERPFEC